MTSLLKQYTKEEPLLIKKNNLTIVYGKLFPQQDMDQIWESDTTALIGRIFNKKLYTKVKNDEYKQYSQDFKKDLTKKVWGKYVFWLINGTNKLEVMVDPTGQGSVTQYVLSYNFINCGKDMRL